MLSSLYLRSPLRFISVVVLSHTLLVTQACSEGKKQADAEIQAVVPRSTAARPEPLSATAPTEEVKETVYNRLRRARPGLYFTDLKASPVAGVYQIKINGQVAFVSANGGHLISGEMYEVRDDGMINLQELERQEAEVAFEPQRARMIRAVKNEDMVIYSPGDEPGGHVWVFTDIDCGFCRKLHSQMSDYLAKGIEIRYLAFPRAGVDSRSAQKLATTWCAEDPRKAMTDFKSGRDLPLQTCENNPVADHYQLGQQLGVRGTPAIVLESGRLIPGAVSPEYLAREMGL